MLYSCSAPTLVVGTLSGKRTVPGLNSTFRSHQLPRIRYGRINLWTRKSLFRVSEKNELAARSMQTGAEHLIKIDERLHSLLLSDDLFPQRILEVARCGTPLFGVQFFCVRRLCCCDHNCSFHCTSSSHRDPFVAHFSELLSDFLSNRSLLLHRIYHYQRSARG